MRTWLCGLLLACCALGTPALAITVEQVPRPAPGRWSVDTTGSISAETLAEVDRLLAAAGTSKARLLTAQIWLADMASFAEMNAVWDAWVDRQNPPARWTGEAKLATPDYKVEIIVTAAV